MEFTWKVKQEALRLSCYSFQGGHAPDFDVRETFLCSAVIINFLCLLAMMLIMYIHTYFACSA